jgi:hypothetical protein
LKPSPIGGGGGQFGGSEMMMASPQGNKSKKFHF